MEDRINVAYYITGHGLGHATRSLELMRGLLNTKKFRLLTISNVAGSFFAQELAVSGIDAVDSDGVVVYQHFQRNLDSGAIQSDPVHMDTLATLQQYHDTIHTQRSRLLDNEVAWLKDNNVKVVLLDATPLGSIAGRMAGARVIFVTNFTWDFVQREMLGIVNSHLSIEKTLAAQFEAMIDQCEEDVACCDHILQYPGATPLSARIPLSKIIPAPLLARSIRNRNLKASYCLHGEKLLLLGFGGFSVNWNLRDHFLPEGWRCVVLRAQPDDLPSDRFISVPNDVYVPDLIYAADVVLGKIGYGFVSECLTAGTPLVFLPRVHWPEEAYMAHPLVSEFKAGLSMPLEAYEQGRWEPYLTQALSLKGQWALPTYHDSLGNSITATERVVELIESLIPL